MDGKRLNLCQCGCGKLTSPGKRYINGHNRNRLGCRLSKETRKKISESLKGKNKGRKFTEEHKKKISESVKGKKYALGAKRSKKFKETLSKRSLKNQYNFIHGKYFILNEHLKHKKQECLFGCKNAKRYDLHHELKLDYKNILTWEGKLVNLCRSCHKRIHDNTLELPEEAGIKWTKEDTKKLFRRE